MAKQLHILKIEDAFTDISDLPLYNFDKYITTSDANWLIEGFTGKEKKLDTMMLSAIEKNLTEQHYADTNDRSFEYRVIALAKINTLATKYVVISQLVDRMYKGFGHQKEQQEVRAKYIQQLSSWGFKMAIMATLEEDYNRLVEISSAIQGIKTQISIEKEKLKQKSVGESMDLYKYMIVVAKALGLNYRIDPKVTMLKEWNAICKQVEELSLQN